MAFHDVKTYLPTSEIIIPGRAYVHSGGLKELYQGNPNNALFHFETEIMPTLQRGIANGHITPTKPEYFLAVLWGNVKRQAKTADVFVFGGIEKWSDNPEVAARVIERDYITEPLNGVMGCGDGIIMLSEEEKLRRTTTSLEDYLGKQIPIAFLP